MANVTANDSSFFYIEQKSISARTQFCVSNVGKLSQDSQAALETKQAVI